VSLGYHDPDDPTKFIHYTSLQDRWLKDKQYRFRMTDDHDCYEEESALRDVIAAWEPNPMHNITRAERFRRFHDIPITTSNQPGNAGTTTPLPKPSQAKPSGRQERRAARAKSVPTRG
jgi:hypothetical protein